MSEETIFEEVPILNGLCQVYKYSDAEVERFKIRSASVLNYILMADLVRSLDGEYLSFLVTNESYNSLCQYMMEMDYAEKVRKAWQTASEEEEGEGDDWDQGEWL